MRLARSFRAGRRGDGGLPKHASTLSLVPPLRGGTSLRRSASPTRKVSGAYRYRRSEPFAISRSAQPSGPLSRLDGRGSDRWGNAAGVFSFVHPQRFGPRPGGSRQRLAAWCERPDRFLEHRADSLRVSLYHHGPTHPVGGLPIRRSSPERWRCCRGGRGGNTGSVPCPLAHIAATAGTALRGGVCNRMAASLSERSGATHYKPVRLGGIKNCGGLVSGSAA